MSVADVVAAVWWLGCIGLGLYLAVRPVERPAVGKVRRTCQYLTHAARHAYARAFVYRGR